MNSVKFEFERNGEVIVLLTNFYEHEIETMTKKQKDELLMQCLMNEFDVRIINKSNGDTIYDN